MILQLDPPLPMETSRGAGLAHFLIDYGPEAHLMWVVFMNDDGACWTVPNPEVRMQANWSMQRRPTTKFPERPAPIRAPEEAPGIDAAPKGTIPAPTLTPRGGGRVNGHRRYDASPNGV